MSQIIEDALIRSIRSGFSEYEDQSRIATVQFIEKVAARGACSDPFPESTALTCHGPGLGAPFVSIIPEVIPRLTEVALDDLSSDRVRASAIKLSQTLWNFDFGMWSSSLIPRWLVA